MDLVLQSFSVILLLLIVLNLFVETFVNSHPLVYKVEMSNKKLYILNDRGLDIKKYIYNINTIMETTRAPNGYKHVLNINDVFQIEHSKVVSVIPDKKYVVFVMKKRAKMPVTLQESSGSQFKIPIYCKSDTIQINLLQVILRSLSITSYPYVMNTSDLKQVLKKGDNIVMLFDTIKNIKSTLSVMQSNTFEFVEYESYDIHDLKVTIPYVYSENLDMSLLFPNYKSRFPVKKVLAFDMFITASNDESIEGYEHELYELISNVNIVDQNNYYTMFFPFVKPTLQYLRRYNSHIQERDKLPILEQYVEYSPAGNVNGYYDSKTRSLQINSNDIDGVPVNGNTFYLKQQIRNEENGKYTGDKNNNRKLIKILPEAKDKDDGLDSRYRCYGDPSVINKGLCNSRYDELGKPKQRVTVWDRPCETNSECPFYQANKVYKNYRGGCNDGYCEFPLGIKRTSYRYYDLKSKPICHNCTGSYINKNNNVNANINCCDQQPLKDYAFELDFDERRAQNIK